MQNFVSHQRNPAVRVELQAPDISAWLPSTTGVPGVHVFQSSLPGPTVLVQALTHGNEICGAIALHWLLPQLASGAFKPLCGQLVALVTPWSCAARANCGPSSTWPTLCWTSTA
jgi:predicted deacylase